MTHSYMRLDSPTGVTLENSTHMTNSALPSRVGLFSQMSPRISSKFSVKRPTLSILCCKNESQHTATHCNTLQHAAIHCNTLQYTATRCNTLQYTAIHCNTLQYTASHCNTLQYTAIHCNTLQHTSIRVTISDFSRGALNFLVARAKKFRAVRDKKKKFRALCEKSKNLRDKKQI